MEAGIRYAEERDKASGKAETAAGHEDKGDFTDSNLQGEWWKPRSQAWGWLENHNERKWNGVGIRDGNNILSGTLLLIVNWFWEVQQVPESIHFKQIVWPERIACHQARGNDKF